ncbi:MAG: hypothetical protein ACI9MB_001415, partial [Verrucomicrobiales bacterium]
MMKKTKMNSLFAINTAVCAAVALAFSSCEKAKDAADSAGEGVKEVGAKAAEGAKAAGEVVK